MRHQQRAGLRIERGARADRLVRKVAALKKEGTASITGPNKESSIPSDKGCCSAAGRKSRNVTLSIPLTVRVSYSGSDAGIGERRWSHRKTTVCSATASSWSFNDNG